MDVDHVLTVTIAWLMLSGAVMPNLAALFMRYDTRRRWLLAIVAPFIVAAGLFVSSVEFFR